MKDFNIFHCSIVSSFEEIKTAALTEPADTKEVIALMKYVEVAQSDTIIQLMQSIKVKI